MRNSRIHAKRFVGGLIAAALIVASAVWLFNAAQRDVMPIRPVVVRTASGIPDQGAGGVDVPFILLADYYEHAIEHAPPRDPSGCMQRRERFYTSPPNPFTLARERLSGSAQDVALRAWIDTRWAGYLAGDRASPAENPPLGLLLNACSLDAQALLEIGRGFNFLEGDRLAAMWYRAGIMRARSELVSAKAGDEGNAPYLHLMDQTKALWKLKDHSTLEVRFELAKRLNVPLSPAARRAGYFHAEMLSYQGRVAEAADAMVRVQAEHERAGDLGSLDKSDLQEMAWVQGLLLFSARRYEESLPHWSTVLETASEQRRGIALDHIINALTYLARTTELEKYETRLKQHQSAQRGGAVQ